MAYRYLSVSHPHKHGPDVVALQQAINRRTVRSKYARIDVDGDFGGSSLVAARREAYLLGLSSNYLTGPLSPHLQSVVKFPWRRNPAEIYRSTVRFKARAKYLKEHANTKQALAAKILASPNARFDFNSPTGGTARAGFEAIAAGHKAPCAATGVPTDVSLDLLRALAEMVDHGVILINCLTNGEHTSGSRHYRGLAVDLDNTSPLGFNRIVAIAHKYGGTKNFETSHYHLDF